MRHIDFFIVLILARDADDFDQDVGDGAGNNEIAAKPTHVCDGETNMICR